MTWFHRRTMSFGANWTSSMTTQSMFLVVPQQGVHLLYGVTSGADTGAAGDACVRGAIYSWPCWLSASELIASIYQVVCGNHCSTQRQFSHAAMLGGPASLGFQAIPEPSPPT